MSHRSCWVAIMALGVLLILSNLIWIIEYHKLWLDDAQASAWLDWDREYMRDFDKHERVLYTIIDPCDVK